MVMTGYADKEIILRALKADADDFIQKPLNLLQLKSTVEQGPGEAPAPPGIAASSSTSIGSRPNSSA